MLFEAQEDTFKAYLKFLKKEEYKKAYQCLEKLLHEMPKNIDLLESMVDLCLEDLKKPDIGKRWLLELTKLRSVWYDYEYLSRAEASLENIPLAKAYLKKSRELYNTQASGKSKQKTKDIFAETEQLIKLKEWNAVVKSENERHRIANKIGKSPSPSPTRLNAINDREKTGQKNRTGEQKKQKNTVKGDEPKDKELSSGIKAVVDVPLYNIPVKAEALNLSSHSSIIGQDVSPENNTIPTLTLPLKGREFSLYPLMSVSPLIETRLFIDYL